jgi:hypothetical protein
MRKILLITLLMVFSVQIFAEELSEFVKDELNRVEITTKKKVEQHEIIPIGKNGLILLYRTDEKDKTEGGIIWVATRYDLDFKEKWSKEFVVKKGILLKDYIIKNNETIYIHFGYYLLRNIDLAYFSSKGPIQLVTINCSNGSINKVENKIKRSVDLNKFKVIGNKAYLGGTSIRYGVKELGLTCLTLFCCMPSYFILAPKFILAKTFFISIDLNSGELTELPLKLKKNAFVIGAQANDDNVEFVYRNDISKEEIEIKSIRYDKKGNKTNGVKLKSKPDKAIVSCNLVELSEGSTIAIGTYATPITGGAGLMSALDANKKLRVIANPSSGLYFSKVSNNRQDFIRYFPFNKMKAFQNITSKKKEKQEQKGKKEKEREISRLLNVHEVYKMNKEYVMVAEAYYPDIRCYYVPNANGGATRHCTFHGYVFHNSIIASFNEDGELLWDVAFDINVRSYVMQKNVKASHQNDEVTLVYANGGKIFYKVVKGGNVIVDKSSTAASSEVTSKADKKKVVDYSTEVVPWYDNVFVSYGTQKIKEKEKDKKSKKEVFYFSKLVME